MKKFNMLDNEFICENCHKSITKLNYTARDHCNYCLYSKHVDINPGDQVLILEGGFANNVYTVLSVNEDKEIVTVLTELFGSSIPTEFSVNQVKKI